MEGELSILLFVSIFLIIVQFIKITYIIKEKNGLKRYIQDSKTENRSLESTIRELEREIIELNETIYDSTYYNNDQFKVGSTFVIIQDPLNTISYVDNVIGNRFIIENIGGNGVHSVKRLNDNKVFHNCDYSNIRCYLWDDNVNSIRHRFIK